MCLEADSSKMLSVPGMPPEIHEMSKAVHIMLANLEIKLSANEERTRRQQIARSNQEKNTNISIMEQAQNHIFET